MPTESEIIKPVERIKIISMGDGGCGKSCLIKRYCEGKFVSKYISTIGIDYGVKLCSVGKKKVKVNFWDLSGHSEFFEVRNEFYSQTQGALLVFDVASRSSFEALELWLREARRFGMSDDVVIYVVGNKTDKNRTISVDEAREWTENKGLSYYDVSAKSGSNVNKLFNNLFG